MPNILPDSDKLWNRSAEAAVLGSMLIDPDCIPQVLAILTRSDMFYLPEHRDIFDALISLHIEQVPIEAVALRARLLQTNTLERIGGVEYIAKILNSVPSSANCKYYSKLIKDRESYRNMVKVIEQIRQIQYEPSNVNEQIEQVHHLALSLEVQREDVAHKFKDTNAMMESVVSMGDQSVNCVPTGFTQIDNIIHGFHPWEFILIAGRPGMGKSTLAQDIAMNIATEHDQVLIFSLEMGAVAIMQRSICAMASVDGSRWGDGILRQEEFDKAMEIAEELKNRDIVIYDTIQSMQKISAVVSIHANIKKPKLVIVDNVQIVTTINQTGKEYERLTEISRQLKRIPMAHKVPIIAVSHLNRDVEKRTDKRPRISDLKGSGSLEQDADLIMLLYRADLYRKLEKPDIEPDELDGIAELIIGKNRRGRTGIAKLLFREEFTHFVNMAPEWLGQQE